MFSQARARVLDRLAPGRGSDKGRLELAATALRTSMRNQFPCVVKTLSSTGGLVRVGLELPDASSIYARITRESAQLLQLKRGLHLLALCKATAVRIAPQIGPAESRNLVVGTVGRATRSMHGGEVAMQLAGGLTLVGFCEQNTRLKVGDSAMASIDESGVVVAISD